ncbi:MAG: hypothetical protein KBF32_09065 [Chitinophagales bacterium]|nr:hypothetical protein [Chitinophagales bacterium]
MNDTISKNINTDDLAWVSMKINSHYAMVKKSDAFTDEERQCEVNILAMRAFRFGLLELVDRLGYLVVNIPLERGRHCVIVLPKDFTANDIDIMMRHIENLKLETESKSVTELLKG